MNYYQEITLIEQADISYYHIHSHVFQALHNAIANTKKEGRVNLGVSFPEYRYNKRTNKGFLGLKLRVFARENSELNKLDIKSKLDNLSDYVHISSVKEVGDKATHYEVYSKYRHKGYLKKAEDLQTHFIEKFGRNRYEKEFGSFDAVLEHCEQYNKQLAYPFINMKSNSNGNNYCIRIKKEVVHTLDNNCDFDSYGLSKSKTPCAVPAW